MANILIAVVIKFVFVELLLFAQESTGQSVRRMSRKIVFDDNDEDAFEVLSNTNAGRCIEQCKDDKRCIGVNFHTQRKTCHTIYKVGPEVSYRATIEKKSRFICWEKDPSKRQALPPTTIRPPTTTEHTPSTLQTTPNSTEPSLYDYDFTPPSTTRNSGTTTVSTKSGLSTNGELVKSTPRNPQGSSSTLGDEPVSTSTPFSQERKTTNDDSKTNPYDLGTTGRTPFVTTSITGQHASSPPSEGTTAFSVNQEVNRTTTEASTDRLATQTPPLPSTDGIAIHTPPLVSGGHGTTSSPSPNCDENPSHEDCADNITSVCFPPKKIKHFELSGNMYTVGSKLTYRCYNQTTQSWYVQAIRCTARGTWDNMDTVCSYHYPIKVKRKQMMYKFVNVPVTKDQASERCKHENASLLKVNNGKVTRALANNFQSFKGDYWTDVYRKKLLGFWHTSDGVRVKKNANVFETSNRVWIFNWWFKLRCAYLKPIFRLLPSECDDVRPFICEMIM